MIEWLASCMDIARELGATRIGGQWGAVPVEVIEAGEHPYAGALKRQHETLRELSHIARDKGIAAIHQGHGCIPAEPPWTIKQAQELLIEVNRNSDGCPGLRLRPPQGRF